MKFFRLMSPELFQQLRDDGWDECFHRAYMPVISSGEVLAHICSFCDAQLPSDFPSRSRIRTQKVGR